MQRNSHAVFTWQYTNVSCMRKKSIESDPIELGKTDTIGMATEPIDKPGVISEEKSDEKDNNDFGCGGAVGGSIHGSGQST